MKRFSMLVVAGVLCATGSASGQEAPPASAEQVVTTTAEPQSIEDGYERIQKTFGKYDPDNQIEWRIAGKHELRTHPDPAKPEVLQVFDGMHTISIPFLRNETIAFDHLVQWKRQVYDIDTGGKKTQTRAQCSHSATRYLLSRRGGRWLVSGVILSNGVHECMDSSGFGGELRWHDDGFEFVGNNAVSQFYAAEGKMVLGIANGSIRIRRTGDLLSMEHKLQPYELATSPNGGLMMSPDFAKPIGNPAEFVYTSEPLMPSIRP